MLLKVLVKLGKEEREPDCPIMVLISVRATELFLQRPATEETSRRDGVPGHQVFLSISNWVKHFSFQRETSSFDLKFQNIFKVTFASDLFQKSGLPARTPPQHSPPSNPRPRRSRGSPASMVNRLYKPEHPTASLSKIILVKSCGPSPLAQHLTDSHNDCISDRNPLQLTNGPVPAPSPVG